MIEKGKLKKESLGLKKTPVKAAMEVNKLSDPKGENCKNIKLAVIPHIKVNLMKTHLKKSSQSTPTMSFKQNFETEKEPQNIPNSSHKLDKIPERIRVHKKAPVRFSISSKEEAQQHLKKRPSGHLSQFNIPKFLSNDTPKSSASKQEEKIPYNNPNPNALIMY